MASDTQIAKTTQALRNNFSNSRIASLNRRQRVKLGVFIDGWLPNRFRGKTAIQNLIIDLVIRNSEEDADGFQWVQLSSKYLKSSFRSLYQPSLNKLPANSGKSVLVEMIEAGIILRDGKFSKHKQKTLWYRLSSKFPDELKARIMYNFISNQKEIAIKGSRDVDTGLTLIHEIAKNEVQFTPDNFVLKEEYQHEVELTGLTKIIIEKGFIGRNFVTRDLFVKSHENLLSELTNISNHQCTLDTPLTSFFFSKSPRILCTPETPLKDSPYVGHVAYTEYSAPKLPEPHSTSAIEAKLMTDFLGNLAKLSALLGGTKSTCEKGEILMHEADLKICYTGRIFERKGLGTTGLKSSLKAHNYECMTALTGQAVFNYDLRGSQVAGILHYGDLHGFEFPCLESYVSDKSVRTGLAKKVGIPEKLLKTLILIKMFGGKNSYSPRSDSYPEQFRKEGYSEYKTKVLINKFNTVCKDVLDEINIWFEKLIPIALINTSYTKEKYSNGVTIVNKSFLVTAKMQSAFLLQGLEANFIFALINCSRLREFSFYFLSYEFDGLITLGNIPELAIKEASRITGFKRAVLEIKAI